MTKDARGQYPSLWSAYSNMHYAYDERLRATLTEKLGRPIPDAVWGYCHTEGYLAWILAAPYLHAKDVATDLVAERIRELFAVLDQHERPTEEDFDPGHVKDIQASDDDFDDDDEDEAQT